MAKWQSGKVKSLPATLQPCNLQPATCPQPCPMKPKISIIGVGAMACLFAARLHGLAEFYLVGHWPEQIATLRGRGLTLLPMNDHLGHNEHTRQITVPITVFAADEALPQVDMALVLVKSTQTKTAAALAQRILTPSGLAVSLQNGLGNVEILAAALGHNRATGGSTAQGAVIVRPGVVQHTGNGLTTLANQEETRPLADLFNQAGLTTDLIDDLDSLIWGKLIVNAGINPLTALLRQPNGFLATDPTARSLLAQIVWEAAQVAQASGITLPYADPVARTLGVVQVTAHNQSSMLQDVLRGAPTEIEAITGAILRYGTLTHTPTPLNTHLYKLMQTGARPQTITQLAHQLKT
ncbi:MAG: 2-dehydropantoate 2-reductase [Chloroflexi bacterium]|nr:2-dehydropantoate 2-reductase [Chloroflexota bacterium]